MSIQENFGKYVFNKKNMKKKLPYPVYLRWKNAIRKEDVLDKDTADIIAHAMKEWAIEKGATHYSHWFFPLHGQTAKKHVSFLNRAEDGSPILRFSGKELVKGEPDASSFPSGGIRATFEARGYTYWDASSYAFVLDRVLYIPSVFVAYNGETLDMKGPLLRAHDMCSTNATRILNAISDTHTWRVRSYVGMEQEFFLVDRDMLKQRKDLALTGTTLLGGIPCKGQSLEDHYLGAIPNRVLAYLEDITERLRELGIFVTAAHNEVAPCQFEIAPLHEHCNVAVDNNHLIMEVLKKVAKDHNMICLLHEKPFKGVNGSGKHNNWSLVSNFGENCFEPGPNPSENLRFLLFVTAVIEAVDTYQNLFRYSASNPGNDYRLGAGEAPPSIISLTMGNTVDAVLRNIVHPEISCPTCTFDGKVNFFENIPYDDSDRNRTSPFAFTGNKFEFRMPGSSKAASEANIALNAAVGHVLGEYADRLEAVDKEGRDDEMRLIMKESLTKHERILFNGDGYHDSWVDEAKRRGLENITSHFEALHALLDDKVQELFISHDIYTKVEMEALYEIGLEEYIHIRTVEMRTFLSMIETQMIPAIVKEMTTWGQAVHFSNTKALKEHLYTLEEQFEQLVAGAKELREGMEAWEKESTEEQAKKISTIGYEKMKAIRALSDRLENQISEDNKPFPNYDDIFISI